MAGHYHPRHLSTLSQEEVNSLVAVLSLPLRLVDPTTGTPSDLWLAEQSRRIAAETFPTPLRRPDHWLSRLSMSANRHLRVTLEDLVPQCAVLCAAHRALNPWVVRRAFFLVSQEVTGRLDALRTYLARPGRYNGNNGNNNNSSSNNSSRNSKSTRTSRKLTGETVGEIYGLVDRLGGVAALWMAPAVLARIGGGAGVSSPQPRRLRMKSECEACIVAAVGADAQALCDLRACLLGRAHKRKGSEPVLLRLVEAWIGRFPEGGAEKGQVLRESERAAKVVKRVRRAVHDERKRESRKRPPRGGESGGRRSKGGRGSHVDDNPSSLPQHLSTRSSGGADHTPKTNTTIVDIIDSYGDSDEDVDEFDEADPHAANRLQDASSRWYSAFSDAGDLHHPAFRQNAADIEASWAAAGTVAGTSHFAQAGFPPPLRVKVSNGDAKRRMPFEDDDDDEEEEDESDPAQWTDVSLHTLATKATANGQRLNSPVPSMPSIPSMYCAPNTPSHYAENTVVRGYAWGVADTVVASSVYSNDNTAMPHPPADAGRIQARSRPVTPNRPGGFFLDPCAPPPIPCSVASSQMTAWPGPGSHQTTITTTTATTTPSSRRHRNSPSSSSHRSGQAAANTKSHTSLSSGSFKAALDSLNQLSFKDFGSHHGPDTIFGGQIPEGTVLPGESVSVCCGWGAAPAAAAAAPKGE